MVQPARVTPCGAERSLRTGGKKGNGPRKRKYKAWGSVPRTGCKNFFLGPLWSLKLQLVAVVGSPPSASWLHQLPPALGSLRQRRTLAGFLSTTVSGGPVGQVLSGASQPEQAFEAAYPSHSEEPPKQSSTDGRLCDLCATRTGGNQWSVEASPVAC